MKYQLYIKLGLSCFSILFALSFQNCGQFKNEGSDSDLYDIQSSNTVNDNSSFSRPEDCTVNQQMPDLGQCFIYKTVNSRKLRIFVQFPENWQSKNEIPAIVYFHGGGWVSGSPEAFAQQAAYFASRGLVTFNVEYRLIPQNSSTPPAMPMQDAKSAVRWVRENAQFFKVKKTKIAAMGGSAGGQLAASTAMIDGFNSPNENLSVSAKANMLFLLNPVVDNGPDGFGHLRTGDDYLSYSPFHNVSTLTPPTLVLSGTMDEVIPWRKLCEFESKLKNVGVESATRIYFGYDHSFFNYGRADKFPYYHTLIMIDRFLQDHRWLKKMEVTIPEAVRKKVSISDCDQNIESAFEANLFDKHKYGNSLDNTLTGSENADILIGRTGNNRVYGNEGNDIIQTSSGNDQVFGGPGFDRYVFEDGNMIISDEDGSGAVNCSSNLIPLTKSPIRRADGSGVLKFENTEGKVIIKNYYRPNGQVALTEFSIDASCITGD